MQGRSIKRASQIKVLKYLEYMHSQEEERNFLYQGEIILNGISKHLREEVQLDFFGKILSCSSIFKNVFSHKLIEQLSLLMKEITLGPGDIIFNKADTDNRLYYVFKGQVENTLKLNNKIIKFGNYTVIQVSFGLLFNSLIFKINEVGDFFGQEGFFADSPRRFTAKSKGTTHIVYCKREDMLRLIEENPLDFEAFSMIRDEILFKENICGHKCLTCLNKGHIEQKCCYINIRVNRSLLFFRNNFSVNQQRQKKNRIIQCRYNSVLKYNNTKKLLKQYRVISVLESVEQWDGLAILQDTQITDKEFFMRMPKIKYDVENMQIQQETDESFYSGDEDDIQLFSKEEIKVSQDPILFSEQNLSQSQQNINQKTMPSRHQTKNLSLKQDDLFSDKLIPMSTTKLKKENQKSQITKRVIVENVQQQSSQGNIIYPQNPQEQIQRQTSIQQRTLIRQNSNSSVATYNDKYKRNASRNLSHFGNVVGQTIAQINLNLANVSVMAKQESETKIETPRQRSNLSAIHPKAIENRVDMRQNFQEYFKLDISRDLDKMKEYVVYYPSNNFSQVLRQIRKNWIDKFSKKRLKTKWTEETKSKLKLGKLMKSETKYTQKTNQMTFKKHKQKIHKKLCQSMIKVNIDNESFYFMIMKLNIQIDKKTKFYVSKLNNLNNN